jgi:hypothetical protein
MGSFRRLHRQGEPTGLPVDLGDPSYLNWIRSLPCAHCGAMGPSEAHHSTVHSSRCETCSGPERERKLPGKRGKGVKSHDHCAIPLCLRDHRAFHDSARDFKTWTKAQKRAWQEEQVAAYHARYFDFGF